MAFARLSANQITSPVPYRMMALATNFGQSDNVPFQRNGPKKAYGYNKIFQNRCKPGVCVHKSRPARDRSLAVVTPRQRASWQCVPSPLPPPPSPAPSDSKTRKKKTDTQGSQETGKLPFYVLVKFNQTKSERTRPRVSK